MVLCVFSLPHLNLTTKLAHQPAVNIVQLMTSLVDSGVLNDNTVCSMTDRGLKLKSDIQEFCCTPISLPVIYCKSCCLSLPHSLNEHQECHDKKIQCSVY
ncbi:hypothetical protein XENOCAPTIV_016849 [Xenoophorus captivus]|uniref:C2H2-type domain-containing protein n=1 Tax=Xenoophorus captivus TaxID=1517983 RepID=A0ABV0S9R2_9TELE